MVLVCHMIQPGHVTKCSSNYGWELLKIIHSSSYQMQWSQALRCWRCNGFSLSRDLAIPHDQRVMCFCRQQPNKVIYRPAKSGGRSTSRDMMVFVCQNGLWLGAPQGMSPSHQVLLAMTLFWWRYNSFKSSCDLTRSRDQRVM